MAAKIVIVSMKIVVQYLEFHFFLHGLLKFVKFHIHCEYNLNIITLGGSQIDIFVKQRSVFCPQK